MDKPIEENGFQSELHHESKSEGGANKKRVAEKQMRKEEEDDETIHEEDSGTFAKADEETLAKRRKVTVKRRNTLAVSETENQNQEKAAMAWPTFNFTPSDDKTKEEVKPKGDNATKPAPLFGTGISPPTNPFTFSTSFTFTSGTSPSILSGILIPTFSTPPTFNFSSGAIFGENIAKPASVPSHEEESPEEETSSVEYIPKVKLADLPTEPVPSGEEGEQHVFQSRMKLYLLDGTEWKERGLGQLRLNVAEDKSYARLLMRAEGVLRLVLNVRLIPNLKLEAVGDKAARFIAPHPDIPNQLATFLLRARRPEQIKELIDAVEANKNLSASAPKSTTVELTAAKSPAPVQETANYSNGK